MNIIKFNPEHSLETRVTLIQQRVEHLYQELLRMEKYLIKIVDQTSKFKIF